MKLTVLQRQIWFYMLACFCNFAVIFSFLSSRFLCVSVQTDFKNLQSLEICGGGLTDAGVKNLKDLVCLTWLNLSQNCNLTDKSLQVISGIFSFSFLLLLFFFSFPIAVVICIWCPYTSAEFDFHWEHGEFVCIWCISLRFIYLYSYQIPLGN